MAIVSKENKFQIEVLDLSPKTINITSIKNKTNELDYVKTELQGLKQVKEHNIKLALKVKEFKDKYTQEKIEHNNTKKLMKQYYQSDRELNIKGIHCPFLNKEITLLQCQESCDFGYCIEKTSCETRITTIKHRFIIP